MVARLTEFLISTMALAGMSTAAAAQDVEPQQDAEPGWSVTVTPRYQHLLFKPSFEADGLETLPSYGASIAVRSPDARFGIMATYMTGDGNGDYLVEDQDNLGQPLAFQYEFDASREEIQITGEYSPRNTNFTLLGGYHRFSAGNREERINAPVGEAETGIYDLSIDAFELGMRLSSALGEGSRHSVSAQFLFGVGSGRYDRAVSETFGGTTTTDVIDETGTGYLADVALGYNFFITDNIALGARARAYVYYVDIDVDDVDPIFAIAPEVNLSFRF